MQTIQEGRRGFGALYGCVPQAGRNKRWRNFRMMEITRQNEDHSEHPSQGRRTIEDRRYDKKNVSPPESINQTTMRRI